MNPKPSPGHAIWLAVKGQAHGLLYEEWRAVYLAVDRGVGLVVRTAVSEAMDRET